MASYQAEEEEEVVDDSEGETELDMSTNVVNTSVQRTPAPAQMPKSVNLTFDTTIESAGPTPSTIGTVDISLFTEHSALSSTILNTSVGSNSASSHLAQIRTEKSRPRPRPAYKGVKDALASGSTTGSPIESSTSTAQPAPHSTIRTASPSTNTYASGGNNKSPLAAETQDVGAFPQDIAERTKLRTRNAKLKKDPPPIPEDVIDLSSDNDEISAWSSRPTARLKKSIDPPKRAKTNHALVDALVSEHDISFDIPVPTSDLLPHPGSELPPSDPPASSSSGKPFNATPDSLRVNKRDDSPASPPIGIPKRKNKLARPAVQDEIDDELSPQRNRGALRQGEAAHPRVSPQPLFFAGSSSPAVTEDPQALKAAKQQPPTSSNKRQKNVGPTNKAKARKKARDDTDEEWDEELEVKPSKSRKKKGNESDSDGEWGKKSPAKPKRKQPAKAGKTKKRLQVEVLLDPPEKFITARKKTQGGQKGKPPKSNEQVATSDEDSDGSRMPPPSLPARASSSPSKSSTDTHGKDGSSPSKRRKLDTDGNAVTTASSSKSASRAVSPEGGKEPDVVPLGTKRKGKKRPVVDSDDDDDGFDADTSTAVNDVSLDAGDLPSFSRTDKENAVPTTPKVNINAFKPPTRTSSSASKQSVDSPRPKYFAARPSPLSMSDLIRKVNSLPGSPIPPARTKVTPLLKTSRSLLSKIAPLHPNRRTPPPPPPRPPPPKKSKKQLELEEKWELELEDTVEGWYCMSEEERAALRRRKRDMEMGFED